MKSYHDIAGDGGSRIAEQVAAQQERVARSLAGVSRRVAVGSGKGGVGKSTVTRALAGAFAARGMEVAVLDADFNGPTQARMAGIERAVPVPGPNGLTLPRSRDGVRVFSIGSLLAESASLEFDSVARGESHTWRATREFAALGEVLASIDWGRLDLLLFDLPPGAERTVQYADVLGPETAFVLVTIPSDVSRGVVLRGVSALAGTSSRALGYIENMSGYHCADCGKVQPLFPETGSVSLPLPCLGRVPFDPALAAACDLGTPFDALSASPAMEAIASSARRLVDSLETSR